MTPQHPIAPDDGSTIARLTAELEEAGYVVAHVVHGAHVYVQLRKAGELVAFPPAPTLVAGLRDARAWVG